MYLDQDNAKHPNNVFEKILSILSYLKFIEIFEKNFWSEIFFNFIKLSQKYFFSVMLFGCNFD